MCFNAPVSFGTFAIGVFFSWLLVLKGTPDFQILGYFLGFVSLMQMIEFGLWMHPVCDGWNRALSYGGMILNHAQPIVLAGLVLAFSKQRYSKALLLTAAAAYTIWMIQYSLQFGQAATPEGICTGREPGNPHLIWRWNLLPRAGAFYAAFLTLLILFFLVGLSNPLNYWIAAATGALFTISKVLYGKKQATGALWCFFSAFLPAVLWALTG
jgi:hypothetical protein